MLDVAKQAVQAAKAAGADYADGRVVADDTESITVRNQEMEGIDRSSSEGLGIRVLVNGYWGFAATARQEPEEVERTAKLAVEIAGMSLEGPMLKILVLLIIFLFGGIMVYLWKSLFKETVVKHGKKVDKKQKKRTG